jgi:hypothetical protein
VNVGHYEREPSLIAAWVSNQRERDVLEGLFGFAMNPRKSCHRWMHTLLLSIAAAVPSSLLQDPNVARQDPRSLAKSANLLVLVYNEVLQMHRAAAMWVRDLSPW